MTNKMRWAVIALFCLCGVAGIGCSSHDHHHHHRDRWDDRDDGPRPGPRGYRD